MAYGILGNCKPSANGTETLIYTAPVNKKAVGTLVIVNNHASLDARASVVLTSGAVVGSYTSAVAGTSGVAFMAHNALVKAPTSDDGIPVVMSGVVLGPGQSLVAYNVSGNGSSLFYSFSGIEESAS